MKSKKMSIDQQESCFLEFESRVQSFSFKRFNLEILLVE